MVFTVRTGRDEAIGLLRGWMERQYYSAVTFRSGDSHYVYVSGSES